MARTGGDTALNELKRLLIEGQHLEVRKGAGYGLGKYNDPELIGIFVAAIRARLVPRIKFAGVVAGLRPDDRALEELLADPDDRIRRFAVRVVERMLSETPWDKYARRPCLRVLQIVKEIVERKNLKFSRALTDDPGTGND